MFANIGRKIKNFAKFSFGIGVLVSIIGAIYVIVSSLNGREPIVGILTGLLIAVGGVIVSWLQTFLLYGFGELVDSNQKILRGYNDLATTNPELLKEWNYERNNKNGIFPYNVFQGTHMKVWWICDKGHSYDMSPNQKTRYNSK